jgi:hypothetical protein
MDEINYFKVLVLSKTYTSVNQLHVEDINW